MSFDINFGREGHGKNFLKLTTRQSFEIKLYSFFLSWYILITPQISHFSYQAYILLMYSGSLKILRRGNLKLIIHYPSKRARKALIISVKKHTKLLGFW